MDLVCTRYPGHRPSDYLDVPDGFTAFQLDSALALAGYKREVERQNYNIQVINWHTLQVARAMGAKGIPKQPPKPPGRVTHTSEDGIPRLSDLLAIHAKPGTVIQKEKNG